LKNRVKSHVLEKVIGVLMGLFGFAALAIFFMSLHEEQLRAETAMMEILLIIVLAILAQTVVLIRIYEQHYEE
jgi:small-conductance mechanosensitive channel